MPSRRTRAAATVAPPDPPRSDEPPGRLRAHDRTLPRVAADDPRDGFKLLRPHARAERCEGALFGTFSTSESDALAAVFRDLLALDEEATMVRGPRVEWTAWSIGVYGRRCIEMEGDVVRPAATVLLPMAGEHVGH